MPKNSMPWRDALEQRQRLGELGQDRCGLRDRLVGKLDDEIALGDAALRDRSYEIQLCGRRGPQSTR